MSFADKIYFDKPTLVYTAGDILSGAITFVGGPKGIKLFDIQVTLARIVDKPFFPPQYQKSTNIVKNMLNTINGPIPVASCPLTSKGIALTVAANTSKQLDFSIQLPNNLWSTFHPKWGNISYKLYIQQRSQSHMACLEWSCVSKEIVIIGLVTEVPASFKKPIADKQVYKDKKGDENASMIVTMDKTCVIPGEKLHFKVEIWNLTRLPLGTAKMFLHQNIEYNFINISASPYTCYRRHENDRDSNLLLNKEIPVPPGPSRRLIWADYVDIPHVVPTHLGSDPCPCIKVNYEIRFSLEKFVNLRVKLPLHIGTALKSEEEEGDEISLAYGLAMTRSEFSSLEMDSISLSSGDSAGSRRWASVLSFNDAPPAYSEVESAPPNYVEAISKHSK